MEDLNNYVILLRLLTFLQNLMKKHKSLPSTLCQNIVKEKSSISSCFRSNSNVCMIENCIVLYVLI